MSQKILALDLGTFSLKVILLQRQFADFEVLQFIEHPLNLHSRLSHTEQISLALEPILTEYRIADADVISAALPGHLISNRIIELPSSHAKKLDQMVEFELEGFIPTEIDELVIDYHVLDTGDLSKVLCLYLQEKRLVEYLEVFKKVGLDPKYLGSDLIDLANIAQISLLPKSGYYAICDIGHSKTNICIMEGSELRYARTIGIGGLHFTKAIQRVFNLNFEKAEAMKISRGRLSIREQDSDQISRLLNDVCDELVSNIKQTFIGFDSYFNRESKSAIYCTGGGSKLVGILDYISFQLKINVLEIDPMGMTNHQLGDIEEHHHVMTQAMANAIRPVYSNRLPKINFRKGHYSYKQDIQVITKELKSSAIFFLIIILLGFGYYFYADHYYSGKMQTVDKKIEAIISHEYPDFKLIKSRKEGPSKSGKMDQYLRSAKSKLDTIKTQIEEVYSSGQFTVLEAMQEISQFLPKKEEVTFEVTEFNFGDEFISLKSVTDDPRNLSKIKESLETSKLFAGKVETTVAKQRSKDLYTFEINIDLKEKK